MSHAPRHMASSAQGREEAPAPHTLPSPSESRVSGAFISPWRRIVLLAASAIVAAAVSAGICLVAGAWFNRFWFVFFAICAFLPLAIASNRDWLADKPENIYLIVVLCITMMFSWTISVRQVGWDVGIHYKNILVFADWEGGVELSTSDRIIADTNSIDVEEEGLFAQVGASEEVLDSRTDDVAQVRDRPASLWWYVTGIEYVPYALALRACRAIDLSFSRTMVLVRMVGALFYSLVTYFGMRKLRRRKMLYAAIALLPTSVFLASDFGYSYWLFSLCLYGFASLVGMLQGSVRVNTVSLLKMLAALFFGMLPRVVYFPLMFLCLFIPTSAFPSTRYARAYRWLLVGAAFAALGVWLIPRLITGFAGGDTRGGEVSSAGQIAYILSHPIEYLSTFVRFSLPPLGMEGGAPDKEGVNLITGFLSPEASPGLLMNYGYLPRPHAAYTVVMWIVLLWTTLTDKDRSQRNGALIGVVALLLTFGVYAMTTTALYMDFTPVGLNEIHGMQRRYLIPLLFPLLAFVGPCVLGLPRTDGARRITVYNATVLCTLTMVLLLSWWGTVISLLV